MTTQAPDKDAAPETTSRWIPALRRFGPLLALLSLALLAQRAGLLGAFSLRSIVDRQAQLQLLAEQSPLMALGAYVLIYAIGTGACLPLALLLTLTGGLVFGTWLGGAATVAGASGGAILTYFAVRSAFAPSLVGRARRDLRLQRVIEGFGRNAFSYVLTLRLIPFFPFPLVNVGAGLAAAPLRPYALATVVGVAPSSLIYASLGAGLAASIRSPHAVRTALHAPAVMVPLAALTLLSTVPIAIKLRAGARRLPAS